MAMTAAVKDELSRVPVSRMSARKAELATMLRFAGGALAYVNANQAVPNRQNDFVIYGTEGRVIGRNLTRHMQDGELGVIRAGGAAEWTAYSTADVYQRVIADMDDAIITGRDPLASGLDGLRSVELAEAVAISAREGRLVTPRHTGTGAVAAPAGGL